MRNLQVSISLAVENVENVEVPKLQVRSSEDEPGMLTVGIDDKVFRVEASALDDVLYRVVQVVPTPYYRSDHMAPVGLRPIGLHPIAMAPHQPPTRIAPVEEVFEALFEPMMTRVLEVQPQLIFRGEQFEAVEETDVSAFEVEDLKVGGASTFVTGPTPLSTLVNMKLYIPTAVPGSLIRLMITNVSKTPQRLKLKLKGSSIQ